MNVNAGSCNNYKHTISRAPALPPRTAASREPPRRTASSSARTAASASTVTSRTTRRYSARVSRGRFADAAADADCVRG